MKTRDALALGLINRGLACFSKEGAKKFYEDIVAELRKQGVIPPIYPKAQAPATEAVLVAANKRAQRWKERCEQARFELGVEEERNVLLEKQLTEARNALQK